MDKYKHNRKLHNPPFSYFSTIYITLVTIVQGIIFTEIMSLAIDFLDCDKAGSNIKVLECLNAMVIVLIIWHKYANHHQITGWQVTIKDTSILFIFGIFEGLMIASLEYRWAISVHFWIALLCSFTTYAYWHAWVQLKESYVKNIFVEYYDDPKDKLFGQSIYDGMVGFESIATTYSLIVSAVTMIILALSLVFDNILFEILIPVISIIILGYWGWVLDLNQWLCEKKWDTLVDLKASEIDGKCFYTTLKKMLPNSLRLIKSNDKVFQYCSRFKR